MGDLGMTDVVYINRPGDENEELRYSLRSLRNLPHDRVFIVGYSPVWVRGCESITVDRANGKHVSAERNLIAACNSLEVSDPFYVFNDDFYVMRPMEQIPTLHEGPLDQVIEAHREGSAYRFAMKATYDRLLEIGIPEPLGYELHTPMLIEKLGMQMALSLGPKIIGMHNRTMYGNLMEVGGAQTADVKVYPNDKSKSYEAWPLLSTSDRTFKYHPIGRYIRESFPDPSRYEFTRPRLLRKAVRYSSVITHP
jgi:hypothetical protein